MKIEATVLEKTKGPKKIVFKMKRRKGYRRWKGKFHIPSDNFICAEFTRVSVFFPASMFTMYQLRRQAYG